MQEYWLILTLLITISIGIVAFINKIFAKKGYNVELSMLILYSMMLCISALLMFFQWFTPLQEIGWLNIILCVLWGIQFYGYSFVMMSALKYLPTSTYFITVRLSSSFVLLFIGILFFWDVISTKEMLGFVLGIWAMTLLFERDWNTHKDMKRWIYFLLLWIMLLVFGHSVTKLLSIELSHVPTLLFIAFLSAFFTSILFGYKHIEQNKQQIKEIAIMNIFQAFFFFVYFYFLFQVYHLWDLWISYKIQSYSPFIPIILAAIIYREKISLQQWIWILLTVFSLYLFT